jgi:hypothetical protein
MMSMHVLLFIIYGFALGYGILRMPFFRNSGIRPGWLLLFFALHVGVGSLHTIIAYRYYPGHGDIWDYFQHSFLTRHRLTSDFNMFLEENSNWNYLTHNGIILVNVVLNFLSFDNLYINTLLFSFPVFLGNFALFKTFRRRFPRDPLTALTVLLLPSTLFWTSCLHREGAVYGLLGLLFYAIDRRMARRALYCFLLFIAITYFRPAISLSLLPALATGWWLEKAPSRRLLLTMAATITVAGIVQFLVLPGGFHTLLQGISDRQLAFRVLEGHSRLYLPALDGSWSSIWRVLPAATRNGLFEPLPGSGGQSIYMIFSLELMAIWVTILVALLFRLKSRRSDPSDPLPNDPSRRPSLFSIACILFALTGLLMIGFMVPFAGAIVRYRSIFLPFLLAPFLHSLCSTHLIKKLNTSLSIYIFSGPAQAKEAHFSKMQKPEKPFIF